MATAKPAKRKPWKWRQTRTGRVADEMRAQITSGSFGSNQKLPTFDELAAMYNVSRFTIQNAVNLLKKEGFIFGVQRSGLFVSEHPPHLHCIGLVHTSAPSNADWPRFCALIEQSAPEIFSKFPGMSFRHYFNVDYATKTREWSVLEEDIKHRRLAGIITLLEAFEIFRDRLFRKAPIPSCALFVPERGFDINESVTMVNSSYDHFVQKALEKFRSRGCHRLAWLTIPPVRYDLSFFVKQGFEIKPHWLVQLARTPVELSAHITALLMDQPASKRPDALMVADENLVPGALDALKRLNLQPGKDVEVVAHMNRPLSNQKLHPGVCWLGYSIDDILEFSLGLFEKSGDLLKPGHHRMEPGFLENKA